LPKYALYWSIADSSSLGEIKLTHAIFSTRHSLHRYRLHRLELNALADPEQRYRRLVELNVIEQCLNLFKTGVVQKRRVDTYKEGGEYTTPQIHACVFDPNTGDMKRLQVSNKISPRHSQGGVLPVLLKTERQTPVPGYVFSPNFLLFHHYLQINSKEFIEEYHDIYDLVTLGDENVIRDSPHFPEESFSEGEDKPFG
jgi:hypothetical protein